MHYEAYIETHEEKKRADSAFKCEICYYRFLNIDIMRKHINTKHPELCKGNKFCYNTEEKQTETEDEQELQYVADQSIVLNGGLDMYL